MTNERITPKQICEWAHWVPSPLGSGYHCAINWHMSTDPDVADYNVILTKRINKSLCLVKRTRGSSIQLWGDTLEEAVEKVYTRIAAWVNERRKIPAMSAEVTHQANRVAIDAAPLPQDPQP